MTSEKPGSFSAANIPPLDGLVAIVTGGSDGIGYQTSLNLALRGARVYILARNAEKATKAMDEMKKATTAEQQLDLHFIQTDLLRFASVVDAVKQFQSQESSLHILINNAGIMAAPYVLSEDGYESQWQTNYLSPFLLIKLLLPTLTSTATHAPSDRPVRIVNVTSDAAFIPITPNIDLENPNLDHLTGFLGPWKRYCHSKAAIVLHTHHLDTRFSAASLPILTFSAHPGFISTNLQSVDPTYMGKFIKYMMKWGLLPGTLSREDGARTTLACATSGEGSILSGSGFFFRPFGKRDKQGDTLIQKYAPQKLEEKLWDASEKMLKAKGVDV